MDTPQSHPPLATDSFSYSWLVGEPQPPHEPHPRPSHNNFSFDVSISSSDQSLHADKLFSGNLFAGDHFTESSNQASTSNHINPPLPSSSSPPSSSPEKVQHQQSVFPRKFSRFSRRILEKYLGYLLPCSSGAGPRRRCKRVDDLSRRAQEVKSLSNTPETVSPRMSTASTYSTWSDYAESSIYEAILYCKRSSEQ